MTGNINAYIYLYHLDKFCILPDYPETITDDMPSTFKDTNALARTAPVFSYSYSGPRTVQISLKMHRDMMNDLNRDVSNLKDNVVDFSGNDYIDILVKYLQAAALPRYNEYSGNSKVVEPPMVGIRFGNSIFIKGVITTGINVVYTKPILIDDKYACVDVSFTIAEVDPYDADTVAAQGSFRGLTRTFKNGIYKDTDSSVSYNMNQRVSSPNNDSLTESIRLAGTKYSFGSKKKTWAPTVWHTSSSGTTHGGHGRSF